MQFFRDPETGSLFAFEDDVEPIQNDEGVWEFFVNGERLPGPYPATLKQTTDSTPPVVLPSPVQLQAQRDSLLQMAAFHIAPLQDAVEIGDAVADESAKLLLWKKYRVALSRVDLTAIPVAWPTAPELT